MLLAFPVLPTQDNTAIAGVLRRRGSGQNHTLVVISRAEDEDIAFKFATELEDGFHRTLTVTVTKEGTSGIHNSNLVFREAMRVLTTYVPDRKEMADPALMYFDPSYRPVKNHWLDSIQAEYYLNNAPVVFGRTAPDATGAPVMQGPVVFSREFPKKSGLLDSLPENTHWRQYLCWELNNHAVKTNLIGAVDPAIIRPHLAKK